MSSVNACNNLTAGIPLGCGNNFGGGKRIWFLEKEYVNSVNLSSPAGDIASIVTSGSPPANFFEFKTNKGNMTYVENRTSDQATGRDMWEQTVTITLNKREKSKRDILMLMGNRKDYVALYEDNNDVVWYLGENFGLNMTTEVGGSGAQKTDPNQYVVTFVGQEPGPANTLTASAYTLATS